jgi:hypothetical protein
MFITTKAKYRREFSSACVAGNKVILAGGYITGENLNFVNTNNYEMFDFQTKQWSYGSMQVTRNSITTVSNGTVSLLCLFFSRDFSYSLTLYLRFFCTY